mmetsp:Transcript_109953/g.342804  ORF Transcript_109953/g.342804 Transcript_109953/m.342804 type:complete len:289 (+) Transcript_109953:303-1169(+)
MQRSSLGRVLRRLRAALLLQALDLLLDHGEDSAEDAGGVVGAQGWEEGPEELPSLVPRVREHLQEVVPDAHLLLREGTLSRRLKQPADGGLEPVLREHWGLDVHAHSAPGHLLLLWLPTGLFPRSMQLVQEGLLEEAFDDLLLHRHHRRLRPLHARHPLLRGRRRLRRGRSARVPLGPGPLRVLQEHGGGRHGLAVLLVLLVLGKALRRDLVPRQHGGQRAVQQGGGRDAPRAALHASAADVLQVLSVRADALSVGHEHHRQSQLAKRLDKIQVLSQVNVQEGDSLPS